MKKLALLCTLLASYNLCFAAKTTASASKASSADQTVVIVSVPDCADGTPCAVVKGSAVILSQAVNEDMSDRESLKMIENSIVPQIDFNLMTKFVMGASWKQATPEQQAKITTLFKQLLVYQYSNALAKFKGAQVSVDSSVINPNNPSRAAVKGTFKLPSNGNSNNQPVNIEYDLAKIGAAWKVYDVKIENVSIVTTYRSQFNETVQSSGVPELINQLQNRVNGFKK